MGIARTRLRPSRRSHPPRRRAGAGPERRGERGQAVPFVAVVLVLVGLIGVGLVRVAAASADRAATQAAADAAALAGAHDGRAAADRLARRNGARLVSYQEIDLDVVVVVERGRHTARARARWTARPVDWADGGGGGSGRVP